MNRRVLVCLSMLASTLSGCASDSQLRLRAPTDFDAQLSVDGMSMHADAWLVAMAEGDGTMRPTIVVEGFRETHDGVDVTTAYREMRGALRFTANEQGLVALGPLDPGNPAILMDGDTGIGPVENLVLSVPYTLDVSASGSASLTGPPTPGPTNVSFEVSGSLRTACAGNGAHGANFQQPRTGSVEVEIEDGRTLVIRCDGSGFEVL